MPAGGGSYGSMTVGDRIATTLKRKPARQVSMIQTKVTPRKEGGNGKFGGLPGGPSGGSGGRKKA